LTEESDAPSNDEHKSSENGAKSVATIAMFMGLVALILGGVGLAVALSNDGGGETSGGGEASGAASSSSLNIELSEFAIDGDLSAPAGSITASITNVGSVDHNFEVRDADPKSGNIPSGAEGSIDLSSLAPGEYEVFCSVPGHEAAGMVAPFTVTDGGEAVAADDHDEEPDYAEISRIFNESVLAFPAETQGVGNQPLEPTILDNGTKEFTLVAEIVQWEVEPGKFVDGWSYNGQVPGSEIRVDVGDNVRINVVNNLPMATDVHWHGIQTPNNMDGVAPITQILIEPGETFVYEFEAKRASIGMYHAHHYSQEQVPNGLFGTFIIGDIDIPRGETISGITIPEDLEVAQEIPMVLNDAGTIGFSLNGKSFPATAPIVTTEGDWIVVNYYNEGLLSHPMHMHQFPQLVIAKDGIPLDQPYWSDTVNVAPGERYTVLINTTDAGTWVWHCHILTHVERSTGVFGMLTAVVVQPQDA
jgi:FtsP/CotA-like multicopper oxidase with cupredoxin domain